MIISEQWLRTWVDPNATTEALSHKLTMIGLEVDSIDAAAEAFSGVVVAEIISAEQHPDADKLRVCTVNAGDETVQIVCGAPNARRTIAVGACRCGTSRRLQIKAAAALISNAVCRRGTTFPKITTV